MPFRTIIIDGNNLAHYLYNIAYGRKITALEDHLLAAQLTEYIDSQPGGLAEIILCLDWSDNPPSGGRNLRISLPVPGHNADDDILNHVLTCAHSGRECIVVSDDQDLLERVIENGGSTMSRYEFVQLPSRVHPIFCDLVNIHPLLKRPIRSNWEVTPEQEALWAKLHPSDHTPQAAKLTSIPAVPNPRKQSLQKKSPAQSPSLPKTETAVDPVAQGAKAEEPPVPSALPAQTDPSEPACRLSLEGWPVNTGIRFLRQSFCKQHLEQHRVQIESLSGPNASYNDLLTLADLLVETCSQEPGFSCSGSLMDRTRLALLAVEGHRLPLSEIIARTGLPSAGLRRRLKEKAAPWIELIF
jgi:hypothetical protein